jgi:hypothetical protein
MTSAFPISPPSLFDLAWTPSNEPHVFVARPTSAFINGLHVALPAGVTIQRAPEGGGAVVQFDGNQVTRAEVDDWTDEARAAPAIEPLQLPRMTWLVCFNATLRATYDIPLAKRVYAKFGYRLAQQGYKYAYEHPYGSCFRFDPKLTDPEQHAALMAEIHAYFEEPIADGYARIEKDARNKSLRGSIVEVASCMLSLYRDALDKQKEIKAYVAQGESLSDADRGKLVTVIENNRKKFDEIIAAAAEAKGGVDWPEDDVVDAVRYMTVLDKDRGEEINEAGWSKSHGPKGHWCAASFGGQHHAAAVTLGRTLCAHYVGRQLERYARRNGAAA